MVFCGFDSRNSLFGTKNPMEEMNMKPEKQYEALLSLVTAYDCATGENGGASVLKHPEQFIRSYHPFYSVIAEMVIDTRAAMDKKSTKVSVPAVKRVAKSAVHSIAPGIFETLVNGETWYALCDGYRVFRLKDDITSVPHIEKGLSQEAMSKLFADYITPYYDGLLTVPSIADIKAHIAENRSMNVKRPICLDNYIYVDPEFLLDTLEILPDCRLWKPDKPTKPIYCDADNGDALLLPVHV